MLKRFNSFIEKWMALVTPTCLLLGVCFPDIAKCGLPYVPAVFAFMTFAGALKSRFKDVANVFRHPGSLLIIMLLAHVVIPTAACGAGHLFFGNNGADHRNGTGVCSSHCSGKSDVGDDL